MPMNPEDTNATVVPLFGQLTDRRRTFRIAILAEGFVTAADHLNFRVQAKAGADYLLSLAPIGSRADRVAIVAVDCASRRSAQELQPLTDPPPGYLGNTPFDAKFSMELDRLIGGSDDAVTGLVQSVPELQGLTFSLLAVLVNNPLYAGQGPPVGDASICCWYTLDDAGPKVLAHEAGHAAFKLADEYSSRDGKTFLSTTSKVEPLSPNLTAQTEPSRIPWFDLLSPANVALPCTVPHADCDNLNFPARTDVPEGAVGLFEGAGYFACGAYRPARDCMMRHNGKPFCPVCADLIRRRFNGERIMANTAVTLGSAGPAEFWTHAFPVEGLRLLNGKPANWALTYELLSGNAGLWQLPSTKNNARPSRIESIGAGWTTMAIIRDGAERYVIGADFGTQTRALFRMDIAGELPPGPVFQNVWQSPAPEGQSWTHILGATIGGRAHIFSYDYLLGHVQLERLGAAGTAPVIVGSSVIDGDRWFPNLRCLALVEINGAPLVIGIDPVVGVVRTSWLGLPAGGASSMLKQVWISPPGWVSLYPTHASGLDDSGQLLVAVYSALGGFVTLYSVRPDGTGIDYCDRRAIGLGGQILLGIGAPAIGAEQNGFWFFNSATKQFRFIILM